MKRDTEVPGGRTGKVIWEEWPSLVTQTVKNLPANAGDPGSIPGSGKSPGEGNGYPLQYSCLENSMDREAWQATYSPWGLKESDTTERLPFHVSLSCVGEGNGKPLQCSCLENPRDGEPGGLPSMGSHRDGPD